MVGAIIFAFMGIVVVMAHENPLIYTKFWPSLTQPGSVAIHYPTVDVPTIGRSDATFYHHDNAWRSDGRCGAKTNPDGEYHIFRTRPGGPVAQCNPNSVDACCSSYGWCGHGKDKRGYSYCTCPSCEDYGHQHHYPTAVKKLRGDNRCGAKVNPNGVFQSYLTPNGEVAECDPNSSYPCCSAWGFCGVGLDSNGHSHCTCSNCVDFRG